MEELIKNEEFMKKLESAESPEEAVALFKENGVEVTVEELEKIAKMGSGELDEEMLDDVAGGLLTKSMMYKMGVAAGRLVRLVYQIYQNATKTQSLGK